MTTEKELAKAFSDWMWNMLKPGIAQIVSIAVTEAVMTEREACAVIADRYTRDGVAAAAIRAQE